MQKCFRMNNTTLLRTVEVAESTTTLHHLTLESLMSVGWNVWVLSLLSLASLFLSSVCMYSRADGGGGGGGGGGG